jgi:flagellar hook-associated protein 2
MGSIVSTGVGSGLDVTTLVQKLVEAEGAPKSARLDSAEAKAQGKLSALGTLRASLASLRDAVQKLKALDSFRGRAVTLSSKDFLAATASTSAAPASYSIEVDHLAQAHKIQSDPFTASTTVVGTGTLTISSGGQQFSLAIDDTNSTVAGIASAINASPSNTKVTAAIITGPNGGATLTLTAKDTGETNAITIAHTGGDGGLAQIDYSPNGGALHEIQEALNAEAIIDGVTVASATNTIAGAIQGVDVTLLAPNDAGKTTTVSVGYDREGARSAIEALAKSYNSLVDAIKSVASYNAEKKAGGPLFGDAGVRNIVYQLRRELSSSVPGVDSSYDMLGKIGVSIDLDGKMQVNGSKVDSALSANVDAVGGLFTSADSGLAVKLDKALEPYLQTGGVFDNRNASLKSSIDDIDEQREALGKRLESLQARYLRQFNALDGLLAQLNQTSGFLTQQLSRLPGTLFEGK